MFFASPASIIGSLYDKRFSCLHQSHSRTPSTSESHLLVSKICCPRLPLWWKKSTWGSAGEKFVPTDLDGISPTLKCRKRLNSLGKFLYFTSRFFYEFLSSTKRIRYLRGFRALLKKISRHKSSFILSSILILIARTPPWFKEASENFSLKPSEIPATPLSLG